MSREIEDSIELMKNIATAANESASVDDALTSSIKIICRYAGWPIGHAYYWNEQKNILTPSHCWHLEGENKAFREFCDVTNKTVFIPGEGLPGRVFKQQEPVWIENVVVDANFPRNKLLKNIGVHAAFGIPILYRNHVQIVLEFFSPEILEPDYIFLKLIDAVGGQLSYTLERHEREQEILRSNLELERFAYVASHDLQEPVRMVANFTDLLKEEYNDQFDESGREYLKIINEGAKRMQTLVSDLLDYARMDYGSKRPKKIDANTHLRQALENLQEQIKNTGAKISSDPLPEIYVNPVRFVRLIQNLLINGMKYRHKNKVPEIHIGVEDQEDEWVFSVRDNGIGMKKEYLQQIFVIFKRLHDKKDYEGTGIGLAVCNKIVDSFGGKIWAESEIGKGSTFYFTIPKPPSEEP